MDIALGLLGFIVGVFMWSNIYGSIFGTMPVERKAVKAGLSKKINWAMVIIPIIIAIVILTIAAKFSKNFFYGSIVAAFIMLFQIHKLRIEAVQNFQEKYERENTKV
jgi:4-hydroxybenzoate polyprenyltransferase